MADMKTSCLCIVDVEIPLEDFDISASFPLELDYTVQSLVRAFLWDL